MMQPPDALPQFSELQNLEFITISILSFLFCLLLVVWLQLHALGRTLKELADVLRADSATLKDAQHDMEQMKARAASILGGNSGVTR